MVNKLERVISGRERSVRDRIDNVWQSLRASLLNNPKKIKPFRRLPEQDPLVRFAATENNEIELQTSFDPEDDVDTIRAITSAMVPLLKQEIERYSINGNRPQAERFGRHHIGLLRELSKPVEEMNFAAIYVSTTQLETARSNAESEIGSDSTEWPDFESDEKDAIDNICKMSGPLFMASKLGRRLILDESTYKIKQADEKTVDKELTEYISRFVGKTVTSEATSSFLEAVANSPVNDPNPARTRRVKIGIVASLVALTTGVAVASTWVLTGPALIAAFGPMGTVAYIYGKKVLENDPDFEEMVADGGDGFGKLSDQVKKRLDELFEKVAPIYEANREVVLELSKKIDQLNLGDDFTRPRMHIPVKQHLMKKGERNMIYVGTPNARRALRMQHTLPSALAAIFPAEEGIKWSTVTIVEENEKYINKAANIQVECDWQGLEFSKLAASRSVQNVVYKAWFEDVDDPILIKPAEYLNLTE